MAEHIYEKADVINRLECSLGKKLEQIDNKDIFDNVKKYNLQKGVAGTIVEQCIFGYPPDTKQEADLIIIDNNQNIKTELKTTGTIISQKPQKHYIAKEPMSITAVGIYDIATQDFYHSHFWEKLENMLIVYYLYNSDKRVSAYEYKDFPLIGYEFHNFSDDDIEVLKKDWENVRSLCEDISNNIDRDNDSKWREKFKEEYIRVHGLLRPKLSYIDLAPKFPPRFRLKKPTVSTIINEHFGGNLEQLPGRYTEVSDIDIKCNELAKKYRGRTVESLVKEFNIDYNYQKIDKSINEKIVVSMFGGKPGKFSKFSLFNKFGLIAKTVVVTSKGGRTEDTKLFQINFDEITQDKIIDDDGLERDYVFEDSELYQYFADNEFLCIVFEEPAVNKKNEENSKLSLLDNKFIGFRRLVFSEEFIYEKVKPIFDDIRNKIASKKLIIVESKKKDGTPVYNKSGDIKSAPNFVKSSENVVFVRGGAGDSSSKHKNLVINGLSMIPQFLWIKGSYIVDEIKADDFKL